jgi:hypothetical protein
MPSRNSFGIPGSSITDWPAPNRSTLAHKSPQRVPGRALCIGLSQFLNHDDARVRFRQQ